MFIAIQAQRPLFAHAPLIEDLDFGSLGGCLGYMLLVPVANLLPLWHLAKTGPILWCLWLAPDPRLSVGAIWGHPTGSVSLILTLAVATHPLGLFDGLYLVPISSFHTDPPHSRVISQFNCHLCLPPGASKNFPVRSELHRIQGILGRSFCYLHRARVLTDGVASSLAWDKFLSGNFAM